MTSYRFPFACDVDYWKTGQRRSAAEWIELAISQVRKHGGENITQVLGESEGRECYLLEFDLGDERHKVVWPVLPLPESKQSEVNVRAARVQAATTLYHEVKHRCVMATRYGNVVAFFQYRLLPDGRNVQMLALPEIATNAPRLTGPRG